MINNNHTKVKIKMVLTKVNLKGLRHKTKNILKVRIKRGNLRVLNMFYL